MTFCEGVTTKVCGIEQSDQTQVRILQALFVLYPSPTLTAQKTSVVAENVYDCVGSETTFNQGIPSEAHCK
jgi:hypothetical protein